MVSSLELKVTSVCGLRGTIATPWFARTPRTHSSARDVTSHWNQPTWPLPMNAVAMSVGAMSPPGAPHGTPTPRSVQFDAPLLPWPVPSVHSLVTGRTATVPAHAFEAFCRSSSTALITVASAGSALRSKRKSPYDSESGKRFEMNESGLLP